MKVDDERIYEENDPIFDERLFEFGNSFIFIPQMYMFDLIDEIMDICGNEEIYRCKYGIVEYKNIKDYSGEWGILKKDRSYSYQNEFRILLQSNSIKPIKFKIPNYEKYIIGLIRKEDTINKIIGDKAVIV